MRTKTLIKTLAIAAPLVLAGSPLLAADGYGSHGYSQGYDDHYGRDNRYRHNRHRMDQRALRHRIEARGFRGPRNFVFVNGDYRVYARDRRDVEVILIVDAYTGAILDVQYVRTRGYYKPWNTIAISLGNSGYYGCRNDGFHDGYYRVRAYDRRRRQVWFRVDARSGGISGISFSARW